MLLCRHFSAAGGHCSPGVRGSLAPLTLVRAGPTPASCPVSLGRLSALCHGHARFHTAPSLLTTQPWALLLPRPSLARGQGDGAQLAGHAGGWAWGRHGSPGTCQESLLGPPQKQHEPGAFQERLLPAPGATRLKPRCQQSRLPPRGSQIRCFLPLPAPDGSRVRWLAATSPWPSSCGFSPLCVGVSKSPPPPGRDSPYASGARPDNARGRHPETLHHSPNTLLQMASRRSQR